MLLLTDMAAPTDSNVSLEIFKNYQNTKSLKSKFQRCGASIIPVVDRAFGLIGKWFDRYIKEISGSPCLKETQNIIPTSTAHTLGRGLSM